MNNFDVGRVSRAALPLSNYSSKATASSLWGGATLLTQAINTQADKVHYVNKKEYPFTKFWDSFKFIVLEDRDDDYLLCDPDIIFHDRININYNVDVIFDAWETFGWNGIYKNDIKTLTD